MVRLVNMIALHRRKIDCLESRVLQKIIDQDATLMVNLVTNNVREYEAQDCEGKLITHFRTHQSDGENWTLSTQEEHA